MKVASLKAIRKFEVEEKPVPSPGAKEALLRVKSIGICASDVHYYMHGKIGSNACVYPSVLGHEPSGIVEKTGKSAGDLKEGDRVIIEPQVPCGKCRWCRQDMSNVCPDVKFMGTPPINGGYSEFITMPAKNLVPLPDNMTFEEGALTEPLAVALHALDLAGDIKGITIGIFGSGTIGLSILKAAKAYGVGKVICTDIRDYRLKKATEMGADHTLNTKEKNTVECIEDITGGKLPDITFEAAGEQDAISDAIDNTNFGGVCIIAGIPREDRITFDIHRARRKELNLKLLRRSNNNVDDAVKLIRNKKVDLKPIVTHRFRLEDISEAFEMAATYSDGVVKTMINAQ